MSGVTGAVLVVGESLIDIVEGDGDSRSYVGGSPLNVAVGLARLGMTVDFGTEFGADDAGARIADRLSRDGVTPIQTAAGAWPTSTARARIRPDGSASYVFDLEWRFDAPPRADGYAIVHVGSVGALREPGAHRVVELIESLPADVLVTFDPNVRPALLASSERTRALVERYAARANVVKLSDEDAEWLYPDDPASAPERLLARGAGLVVVTRGGQGSTIHTPAVELPVPSFPVEVVDTIGAGDSYMSGIIAALVRGVGVAGAATGAFDESDLAEVGRFAATAAGLTVSRAGAAPPTIAELDAVLQRQNLVAP
ncbi:MULTISPECIES: carbohydrate kinase [Microbacterium]|uniref:carbohydrate kinase family protein n=1 Tax=Microbacterium TaxID=33882 RepID=UPI0027D7AF15|nr:MULTISPECIES: carbohydrate kinase [Microbacterium]